MDTTVCETRVPSAATPGLSVIKANEALTHPMDSGRAGSAGVGYPDAGLNAAHTWKIASRSVSRVLYGCSGKRCNVATIPLGPVSPPASSDLPERPGRKPPSKVALRTVPIRSCSRWGLPCRPCYQARGGLLPHPFTLTPPVFRSAPSHQGLWFSSTSVRPKYRRGGLLSVALSLGLPPPGVTRHRVFVEPGLSSSAAFRHWRLRPPDRLAFRIKGFCAQNANPFALILV